MGELRLLSTQSNPGDVILEPNPIVSTRSATGGSQERVPLCATFSPGGLFGRDRGSLTLAFDRVVTPFGSEAAMSAAMTTTATGSAQKNAKIIGGSAAGGALLGRILGGKSKNAAGGALLGAAVGTGVAAGTKGQDVDIPAGSTLTLKLDQPLSISSQP